MSLIIEYFLYFIIYAFFGWLLEVICKLIEKKRFINRGFLLGPICPIYGYGVLAIIILIGSLKGDILAVFLKSILVCSILEYFTSYFMEKLFKARFWDYSHHKYNLNGRICLETMIPFGLLGVLVVYIIHPPIANLLSQFSLQTKSIIATIIFIIYLADNVFSYFILNKIKCEIKLSKKDNTEELKQYIVNWLDNNSIFYRRLKSSYPNLIIAIKNINENLKELNRSTIKNLKSNVKKRK